MGNAATRQDASEAQIELPQPAVRMGKLFRAADVPARTSHARPDSPEIYWFGYYAEDADSLSKAQRILKSVGIAFQTEDRPGSDYQWLTIDSTQPAYEKGVRGLEQQYEAKLANLDAATLGEIKTSLKHVRKDIKRILTELPVEERTEGLVAPVAEVVAVGIASARSMADKYGLNERVKRELAEWRQERRPGGKGKKGEEEYDGPVTLESVEARTEGIMARCEAFLETEVSRTASGDLPDVTKNKLARLLARHMGRLEMLAQESGIGNLVRAQMKGAEGGAALGGGTVTRIRHGQQKANGE
jgi:hypothetical protein